MRKNVKNVSITKQVKNSWINSFLMLPEKFFKHLWHEKEDCNAEDLLCIYSNYF